MEELKVLSIGQKVPDFEVDVYFPERNDFGKFRFSDVSKKGKWLIIRRRIPEYLNHKLKCLKS